MYKWYVAAAVVLGSLLEVVDSSVVNVALPHMQRAFGAGIDQIAWVVTSYLVATSIMLPITGWISAHFSRKRYFILSVVIFVIASVGCGASKTLNQMVLLRLIQGAAGAAMIPTSQAIIAETFPPNEQALGMAVWGIGLQVGLVLGPTIGGWITDHWNWRWIFYVNIPVGAVTLLMAMLFIHDPQYLKDRRQAAGKIDYMGIIYLVVAVGCLQMVVDRGQRAGWFAAPWVRIMTGLSLVGWVVLTFNELRVPDPIVDLRILAIPIFYIGVAQSSILVFNTFGVTLLNPLYLQTILGYSAWQTGLALAPGAAAMALGMLTVGHFSRRMETLPLVGIGYAMMATSAWAMARWDLSTTLMGAVIPMTIFRAGSGLIFPNITSLCIRCVPPPRIGYSASLYNMIRFTTTAVGVAILSNILVGRMHVYQANLSRGLTIGLSSAAQQALHTQASILAYHDAYLVLALTSAICIPGFLLMRRPEPEALEPAVAAEF